jgi:hypothetical protein
MVADTICLPCQGRFFGFRRHWRVAHTSSAALDSMTRAERLAILGSSSTKALSYDPNAAAVGVVPIRTSLWPRCRRVFRGFNCRHFIQNASSSGSRNLPAIRRHPLY